MMRNSAAERRQLPTRRHLLPGDALEDRVGQALALMGAQGRNGPVHLHLGAVGFMPVLSAACVAAAISWVPLVKGRAAHAGASRLGAGLRPLPPELPRPAGSAGTGVVLGSRSSLPGRQHHRAERDTEPGLGGRREAAVDAP
jgi:hypothetical protein